MFFSKRFFCEKCHAPIDKKSMCTFDYSLQGKNKDANAIRLCQNCCLKEFADNFRQHTQKAVIIQPSSKFNSYAFYNFKELLGKSKHSINGYRDVELIENMKRLLPNDETKCSLCSSRANYTYCPLDIFYEDSPYDWEINMTEKGQCTYLCPNCLIELLLSSVEKGIINFNAVFPMVNDEIGFYTPWDV